MLISRLVLAAAVAAGLAVPAPAGDGGARNVILMISDGIGFNGWLAADHYAGLAGAQPYQVARPDGTRPVLYGQAHDALNLVDATGGILANGTDPTEASGAVAQGYDPRTRWTRFDATFANDFPPVGEDYTSYTDSAAAGTALHTGRKTANGRINLDWTGEVAFRPIARIAMDRGRAAGAVSTVMVSHATPASVIARNVSRRDYAAIFAEMAGSGLSVIMGAGHPHYDNSGNRVAPEGDRAFRFVGGRAGFAALTGGETGATFIEAREEFEALATGARAAERVIGIARAGSTLQAARKGLPPADTPSGMAPNPAVPDLATMTVGALNVLDRDPDGFFLMAEGGAVDWMGHANDLPRFIEEQIDFNRAVAAVIAWVEAHSGWDETLLIVTSDHETGGLWGAGTWTNGAGPAVAADRSRAAREAANFDPAEDVFHGFRAVQDRGPGVLPGHQWASGNHTNELVPLWALGAGTERFAEFARTDLRAADLWGEPYGWTGAFVDNTAVFHVMNAALAAKASVD